MTWQREQQAPTYDGDGQRLSLSQSVTTQDETGGWTEPEVAAAYELRSTVLGGAVVLTLSADLSHERRSVYLGGMELAWEVWGDEPAAVKWAHRDASGASFRVTKPGGGIDAAQSAEADPLGQDAGLTDPYRVTAGQLKLWTANYSGYGQTADVQCMLDYMATDCGTVMQSLWAGAAEQCPDNDCGPQRFGVVRRRDGKRVGQVLVPLSRDRETGELGYFPEQWGYDEAWLIEHYGDPQNPMTRPLTDEELAVIRSEFAKMLANDNCRAFIDKLVSSNTGQSFDSRSLLGLFDSTAKSAESGVFFRPGDGGLSGSRNNSKGDLKVFIGSAPPANIILSARAAHLQDSAQTALHEFIHAVTYESDDRLSRDVQKLGIVPIYNGKSLSPPTGQRDGKPYNDYSGYWNSALGNACFPQGVYKP